ncbi:class I SAM-dependent methyltransferase [Flavobacterium aciduliphilum]|uniref:Methyltransferase family protein n=1 Tax=Flavobacterium aciduliphilum TaxID=1101402 RepID=A0A328YR26_9FLAO|nr:class I SAM-dependent methyltransferase [Flavobacterium aciduliphilum]RAR75583.1 methyltransferase family protein [Flavobacterium aciduliphilum]
MDSQNYIEINRKAWNEKTAFHVASDFYEMNAFLEGKSTLNPIELELLKEVTGKKILHLQCHFGQDSMTLSRMGAHVTGIDLSNKAIEKAKEIAQELHLDTQFVCCSVYDTPQYINETFDIVFTSYGTIGWLPDLNEWAKVIAHFLKPSGRLIMADFHPVVWMYDTDFKEVFYSYFNVEPIIEEETGTYADKEASIISKTISWNHPISEILNALLSNGLTLSCFHEYDYSPYSCFNNVEEFETGKFRIKSLQNKIPMVYALEAVKP